MQSKLAASDYAALVKDGLQPTFSDAIRLNAAGLRVERAADAVPLGAPPRVAYLGDWCLWEPTLGRLMWLDRARQMVGDAASDLALSAFACWASDADLPDLKSVDALVRAVEKFRDKVLREYTLSQVVAAVSYAMDGADPADGEDIAAGRPSVKDPPAETLSAAWSVFAHCVGVGQDADAAVKLTYRNAVALFALAAMREGVDIAKDKHATALGDYCCTLAQIKARLLEARAAARKEEA